MRLRQPAALRDPQALLAPQPLRLLVIDYLAIGAGVVMSAAVSPPWMGLRVRAQPGA